MAQLFPKADASEYQADPAKVQALLHACQQDLGHGVVEISYTPQDQTVLFFVENKISSVYTVKPEGWNRQPAANYPAHLQNAESKVRIIPLPLVGIRIGRIMLEGLDPGHTFDLPSPDLKVHFNEWQRRAVPTLTHIRWPAAEAVLLIPGNQMPLRTALFTSREQCLGEEKAVARMVSWPEAHCEVTAYTGHTKTEAYRENLLNIIFIRAMELILTRFSDISGRRLANAVSETMNIAAQQNHWHISAMDCQVSDDEVFPFSQDAFIAYRTLIGSCLPQIEKVIGSKLTNSILQETNNTVKKIDQEILQQYPLLFPEKAPHG